MAIASMTVQNNATLPPTSSVVFVVTLDIWLEIALIANVVLIGETTIVAHLLVVARALDATLVLVKEMLWTENMR